MGDKRRGFIPLWLTVVAAILVTALAISVPHWLHVLVTADEDAARESLHAYNLALFEYWTTYETYPKALANLGAGAQTGVAAAGLVDPMLASGRVNGYVFAYVPGELDFDGTTSTFVPTGGSLSVVEQPRR